MRAETQEIREGLGLGLLEERGELGVDPFGHEVAQVQLEDVFHEGELLLEELAVYGFGLGLFLVLGLLDIFGLLALVVVPAECSILLKLQSLYQL